MKISYNEFNGFKNVFLEDSFVLELVESPSKIIFIMELVLTKNHPMYSIPKPNEFHCYKNAEIIFSDVTEIDWIEKTLVSSKDATGKIDYGNIDELYFEDGFYYIFGDIGELKIKSPEPKIKYL